MGKSIYSIHLSTLSSSYSLTPHRLTHSLTPSRLSSYLCPFLHTQHTQAVARLLILLSDYETEDLRHAHGVETDEELCDLMLEYATETLRVRRR